MKKIVIGIIIILVIVLAGLFIWNSQEKLPVADECKDIGDSETKDTCYANLAVNVGGDTGDEEWCIGISTQTYKDTCYYNVGIKNQDPAICEEAGSQKDFCLSEVARLKEDELVCEKISDGPIRNNCYSNF